MAIREASALPELCTEVINQQPTTSMGAEETDTSEVSLQERPDSDRKRKAACVEDQRKKPRVKVYCQQHKSEPLDHPALIGPCPSTCLDLRVVEKNFDGWVFDKVLPKRILDGVRDLIRRSQERDYHLTKDPLPKALKKRCLRCATIRNSEGCLKDPDHPYQACAQCFRQGYPCVVCIDNTCFRLLPSKVATGVDMSDANYWARYLSNWRRPSNGRS